MLSDDQQTKDQLRHVPQHSPRGWTRGRRCRTLAAMCQEDEPPTVRIRAELQEIFEVLKRERPDAPTLDLWMEALSLHRVRKGVL